MPGDLGYYTVPAADLEKGKRFWGELFGWRFGADDGSDTYAHADNTTPPGGLHKRDGAHLDVWFRVEDIGASVLRVRELGGTAAEPEESASGWGSECRDDQGTMFNLWQPAPGFV